MRSVMRVRLVVAAALSAAVPAMADLTLMNFNNSGFGWMYGGFTQTLGPEFITLSDPNDGWGGGGLTYGTPRDFSALASGHLRIDARVNAGNDASAFTLALRDADNNQGKWNFSTSASPSGSFTRMTAATNLATPQSGVNDWQNLDLGRITQLELQGQWSGASSFNMSFDNLVIQTDGFIERYTGHSPDAPWRVDAAQRIDQLRKAQLTISVRDALGNAVPDAQVQVRQQRHQFGFGSAVALHRLASETAENVAYKQKVRELFNVAVNENDLKWPAWAGEWGANFTQAKAQAGLDWLGENDIRARGHVMVWPGYNNVPLPVRAMIDEYRAEETSAARKLELKGLLHQTVLDHIADIGSATAGKIDTWDVLNEPRANHDLMDILGDEVMAQWFTAARAAAPQARLFINEYDIITSTGSSASSRDRYFGLIESLQASGAPVEGLGMQGHFSPGSLTAPEQVWAVLDRFAQLEIPIQITEFDLNNTDRELQRDYLRDFMTAVFAHGSVTDFIQWGFWAGAHWRPEAAMYDVDWSIRPHGEEFLRLVFDEWWTSEELLSLANGDASLRAFLGDYEITVAYGDFLKSYQLELDEASGTYSLVVTVPEPGGLALLGIGGLLLGRRRVGVGRVEAARGGVERGAR